MIRLIVLTALVASLALAAGPVAKITSPGAFQLSGQRVPDSSVPNWPVVSGDSVALGKKPARVSFRDGSVIFLTPESKADFETVNGKTVVRLQRGAAAYRFTRNSSVQLAGGKLAPVSSGSREGRMLVNGADALWNPAEAEFYAFGDGASGRRNQQADQVNMDPNNYNLGAIDGYRGYEPDWGTPPGDGGSPTVPPPATTDPGQPNPASPHLP